MNTTSTKTENVTPSDDKASALSPAARKAWQVNFTTPAPKTMPTDRLKARAELVRKALGCGGGGGTY